MQNEVGEVLQSRLRQRAHKAEDKKGGGDEELVECSVCGNSFALGYQVIK